MTMRMNNATRSLVILVLLLFAIRPSMHGQTTTTNTDCTINGNTANCTSTSTDDSAQRQAQAAAQAEKDRQAEELGKSVGNATGGLIGLAMRKHAIAKQYKAYCNQHPGEPWARRDAKGSVLDQGTCPGTLVVTKQELIEAHNASFRAEKVVGYAESSGDTFTIHSERASEMRFHMLLANQQLMGRYRAAGVKTIVYTNDSDQRFTYDLVADHLVTPDAPVAAAPTPSATTEEESLGNAGPSDTATKAAANNIPQSAPAVTPAALAPATTAATADPTRPCVTDKSGHTVCLDQH